MDSMDGLVHKLWNPLAPIGEVEQSSGMSKIADRFQELSRMCAILVLVTGCYVMMGWLLSADLLKNPEPGGPAIKVNCALSMISMSVALLLLMQKNAPRRRLAHLLSFVALSIGLGTAFEYMTGWDLGIDQLLFKDDSSCRQLLSPGRIAPNTTLIMIMCATALLTLDIRGRAWQYFSQILACGAVLISILGSVGHVYGVPVLCQIGVWAEIKLTTALTFAVLALGIFLSRPNKALARIISSEHVGGIMARRFLPFVLIIPLILGWVRLLAYRMGLLDVSFGTALLVVVIITLFSVLVLRIAGILNAFDRARSLSELALKESQLRLQESEKKYRLLWETTPDAVVVMDKRSIIRFANHALLTVLGHEPADVIDSPFAILEPQQAAGGLESEISHYFETGERKLNWRGSERPGLHKSGRIIPLEASFAEIEVGGQHLIAVFMRDISERKEVDRVKGEFVSVVSHELRTPLTSIFGSLSLLEGGMTGELPEEALEMVQIARTSSSRLILLINDILDLNKIEAGKFELNMAEQVPGALVSSTLAQIQGMSDKYGIKLAASLGAEELVLADGNRIIQVLTNLVSNAIRFSQPGGQVQVVLSQSKGAVRFAVVDQGKGIAPEDIKKLFKKFQQVDSSDTRQKDGTGLGLAICKSIVELHGGIIGVETRVGHGSTFWFELPSVGSSVAVRGIKEPPVQACEVAAPIRLLEPGAADDYAETSPEVNPRAGIAGHVEDSAWSDSQNLSVHTIPAAEAGCAASGDTRTKAWSARRSS